MNDFDTGIAQLKDAVRAMCIRKGWGDNGVQDPQHVAMAMTVEMSEVLEHFQWLNAGDVKKLKDGEDPTRCALIAEELADVMIYGMQLAYSLNIDITEQIYRKIDIVDHRRAPEDDPKR